MEAKCAWIGEAESGGRNGGKTGQRKQEGRGRRTGAPGTEKESKSTW